MTRDPRVFQPVPRAAATVRLFCFHPAGYGAAMYREWGRSLPPKIEVCAVRLPGRENLLQAGLLRDFNAVIDWVCAAVEPFLDRPYAAFGHSMGAYVAFETLRRLRNAGNSKAVHLFVSGRHAARLRKASEQQPYEDGALIENLQRQYQGVPAAVLAQPDLLQLMLPILRADLAALHSYRYADEPPLSCPITCYAGTDDTEVTQDELEAWRSLTSDRFEIRRFSGSHFYLLGPARNALLDHIQASVETSRRHPAAVPPQRRSSV